MNIRKITLRTFNIVFYSFCCLLMFNHKQALQAQDASRVGIPFLRNYSPKEYKGDPQIWAITQGLQGKMYFGTTNGLLEYDGRNWQTLLPGKMVRSLDVSQDGTVYVGLGNDLGYLATDPMGKTYYKSLLSQLLAADRKISDVWSTYVTTDGAYFMSREMLCRFKQKKLDKIWRRAEQGEFWCITKVNDVLYVNTRKGKKRVQFSFSKVSGNTLQSIESPPKMRNLRMWFALPYRKKQVSIVQRGNGLWLYDPTTQKITPFNSQLNKKLKDFDIYSGTTLPNGWQVLSSMNKGIIIINEQGEIVNKITKEQGLTDNTVWYIYCNPHTHDLWLGTNNGITKLTINSPITFFGESSLPEGTIEGVYNYQGNMYVATSTGFFKRQANKFIRVKGIRGQTWDETQVKVAKDKPKLLVANYNGVYEIQDTVARKAFTNRVVFSLYPDQREPTKVYVGLQNGMSIWEYRQGQWKSKINQVPGLNYAVRDILQDGKNRTWLATEYNGIGLLKNNRVMLLDTLAGLPEVSFPSIITYNQKLYVTTSQGIYSFDEQSNRMKPDNTFEKLLGYQQRLSGVVYDTSQRYFAIQDLATKQWVPYKKTANNRFKSDTIVWKTIQDTISMGIVGVSPNGVYWVTNDEGLFRYDVAKTFRPQIKYHTLLRSVFVNNDSLVYRGGSQKRIPVFEQTYNSLAFIYASPYFTKPEKIQYSYQLVGHDKTWSKWSLEGKKEYSNLREGTYTFKVKARNIYGIESSTATYQFKVLPPWYRTWWAYTLYVVGSILLIVLIVWLNSARLVRQKMILEGVVLERTEEIQSQYEEIQSQNEEIQKQNNAIMSKNQLLTKKNHQINQSIKAAKIIQEAILPFEQRMKQQLKDYFLIYRPKDVVSGDFYWMEQFEDKQIIGVIDCTGHGVPGAFTSMIGVMLLNKIINEQRVTCPEQILERLRTDIRYALRQDETKNNSGMDAIFVTLTPQENGDTEVCFAGAKRPLWYVDEDSNQLQSVKGSPVSIGIVYPKPRVIKSHTIMCKKGTMLYLSTDGFIDQNNTHRRKIGSKLLDLLYTIHKNSLVKQKQLLEQLLDDHMTGDVEQRDDILMIGLRLT